MYIGSVFITSAFSTGRSCLFSLNGGYSLFPVEDVKKIIYQSTADATYADDVRGRFNELFGPARLFFFFFFLFLFSFVLGFFSLFVTFGVDEYWLIDMLWWCLLLPFLGFAYAKTDDDDDLMSFVTVCATYKIIVMHSNSHSSPA